MQVRTLAYPLEGLKIQLASQAVRDHGVPKDPVFGWFATVGMDSPCPNESKQIIKNKVRRAVSALYSPKTSPNLTRLCRSGQRLCFGVCRRAIQVLKTKIL